MAKAIKSFAVDISRDSTTTTTIYTCPASTTAKVIVSSLYISCSSTYTAKLSIGLVDYATNSAAITLNSGVSSGGAVSASAPIEVYITAGQTILVSTTVNPTGGDQLAVIKAQICVIEA